MKGSPLGFCRSILLSVLVICFPRMAGAQAVVPYVWKNVQIVGGGFVPGFVFHPYAAGVRYARTDMGGAYRWDTAESRWQPMLDWLPYEDRNLMGVESIAVDPSDPQRVYLALGTYTSADVPEGAVLRSDNGGRTFERADVPFRMGGNENGRGNGERLAVDPADGTHLLLGTRHDGLWRSRDRGVSWEKVDAFPDLAEPPPAGLDAAALRRWMRQGRGSGIVSVVFAPLSGAARPPEVYAAVSLQDRENLFRSRDGGETWEPVPGAPRAYRPNHAVVGKDGVLYLSYGDNPGPAPMDRGAVWKYEPEAARWTDITPDAPGPQRRFGYSAVAVDASDPRTLLAASFGRHDDGGEDLFLSRDAGSSWLPVFESGGSFDFSRAPYAARTPIHWLFDVEIDPVDTDHALFTTGYGGYETFNLSAADRDGKTLWLPVATGIEETVALDLLSPPEGAALISAIGDYGGFVHFDLDHPAPEGNFTDPSFGNTTGLAMAALRPEIIVRVGVASGERPGPNIGFSVDGGRSWQPTATQPRPDSKLGSVAVSSRGELWIWTPDRSIPYRTQDRGQSWTPIEGLALGTRVVADTVDPHRFYALDLFGDQLFESADAGSTFTSSALHLPGGPPAPGKRGDPRGGQDRLYATPGRSGDLWIAGYDGLYHLSTPHSLPARLPSVSEIHAFGFGRAAPGAAVPALYLVGVVDGTRGIFRSVDEAGSWVRINDDAHQWGLILQITGDPDLFGRVYVGTHGRGILYGDPLTPPQ